MPKVALLPQRDELTEDIFCNNETMQEEDCRTVQCKCLHGIKVSQCPSSYYFTFGCDQ